MSLPSVDEARELMLSRLATLPAESIRCIDANGRLLREDVIALRDQPPFAVAAMDGWAVRRADLPAELEIVGGSAAGHGWKGTLGPGEAVRISTGAAIPDGCDWVIMQEEAAREGNRVCIGPSGAANFIRPRGSDFAANSTLLRNGTRLDPWRIALAASAGRVTVQVSGKLRVVIVSTGDELAPQGATPGDWQIHDSVGPGLVAWFSARGCNVMLLGALPDDRGAVAAALSKVECDLLVTIGGASVGDHDVVKPALRDLGLDMVVEGVAVRPGKPTWFGVLEDGRRVLGLPGNPVSAMVCAELFAAPIIASFEGAAPFHGLRRARLASPLPANGPREHFMRALLISDEQGGQTAQPLPDQDSSLLTILAQSSGLIRRQSHAPASPAGEVVQVLVLDRLAFAR